MGSLSGKVAIVTGASKGIGAGIALALAEAGARVAVNYASSREGAEAVVKAITAGGGEAFAVGGDVGRSADVERLFAETASRFGSLDVLVNNAGVFRATPIDTLTEADVRDHFDVNVLGLLLATRAAAAAFGERGGSIINIGSIVSRIHPPGMVVYNASKAAVDAITRTLAKDLGPRGIRVNSINPGGVDTEGSKVFLADKQDMRDQMIATNPLGRIGEPRDIARVAVFLASEDAAWVTGETIAASGGS